MKPTPMWRRFDRLFGADRASDVRDELRFHIEAKTDDLIAKVGSTTWPAWKLSVSLAICLPCSRSANALEGRWIDISA